jgi:hypothetical protein
MMRILYRALPTLLFRQQIKKKIFNCTLLLNFYHIQYYKSSTSQGQDLCVRSLTAPKNNLFLRQSKPFNQQPGANISM